MPAVRGGVAGVIPPVSASYADADAPGTEITSIAVEYGTVEAVLQSLRADAVLHAYGDPTAPDATAIRAQVRAAFVDDDPAWLERCWRRCRTVVTAAIERLG